MSEIFVIQCAIALFLLISSLSYGYDNTLVNHYDNVVIDERLTLTKVIDLTLEKYPDRALNLANTEEVEALQQRGNSWLAGAPNLYLSYLDDLPGDDLGSREIQYQLQAPLWNWGQRSAAQAVAEQVRNVSELYAKVTRYQVAGLVRQALWDIALQSIRHQQVLSELTISEQLFNKIKRRVELGDLPQSDALLARGDLLQKQSLLTQAEAELMHVRKNYLSLTQLDKVPAFFQETLSEISTIPENHPQLLIINAIIQQKVAEVEWTKSAGSGQTRIAVGGRTERGTRADRDIDSMYVTVDIPFGGQSYLAPKIATVNKELTQARIQRDHLIRQLEKKHHEAHHALQITEKELAIATELNTIGQAHLKVSRLSFAVGEINLLDLLKIQAQADHAGRYFKEQKVMLQKNIALYNQIVGVQP